MSLFFVVVAAITRIVVVVVLLVLCFGPMHVNILSLSYTHAHRHACITAYPSFFSVSFFFLTLSRRRSPAPVVSIKRCLLQIHFHISALAVKGSKGYGVVLFNYRQVKRG